MNITGSGVPEDGIGNEGCPERNRRAAPMAPDDRRAAILDAAVPLLRDRGPAVTTRELAEAAGVAEGTLFRVFPDKEALIYAAVEQALDPTPVTALLAGIDTELDLREVLVQAVAVVQSQFDDVAVLLSVSHELSGGMPAHGAHGAHGPRSRPGHHPVEMVVRAVAGLLHPHRERLRLAPDVCARMLVGIVIATTRPLTSGAAPALTPRQIVDLFLDGALDRTTPSESPC